MTDLPFWARVTKLTKSVHLFVEIGITGSSATTQCGQWFYFDPLVPEGTGYFPSKWRCQACQREKE
jgi:hypothetical protein